MVKEKIERSVDLHSVRRYTPGMTAPRRAGRPRNPIPRSQLVSVARAAFSETGYAGASMSSIAARVGIRKSSLFHHFANKEALYMEVLAGILGDLAAIIQEADLASGSFGDRLGRLAEVIVDYLSATPEAARLLIHESTGAGPFMQGPGRQGVQQTLELIAAFLQGGIDEGAIPDQDTRQLAMSIVGAHLVYFAATDITTGFLGSDIFSPDTVAARRVAARAHILRLSGVRGATEAT